MKIFAIFERTKPNTKKKKKIVVLKLAAVKFAAISDQVAVIRVRMSSRGKFSSMARVTSPYH